MRFFKFCFAALTLTVCSGVATAQIFKKPTFTRQDTLRGSITPERAWWDVVHYDISVQPDIAKKTIKGTNQITFRVTGQSHIMQLDLQEPMQLDSVLFNEKALPINRNGNVFYINFSEYLPANSLQSIIAYFSGTPKAAKNAPWDGGWIWKQDKAGNPWLSVACQGLGASVWYPNKDHQSDEADSAALTMVIPEGLVGVSNGRLRSQIKDDQGLVHYRWAVTNPINNYNIIPYIGKYVNFSETFAGEKGPLDCSYWVLAENLEKARSQFAQVKPMLSCFEKWFGPYPFYEDNYKLVEAPHLGMEHQSAVAYGNGYANGYQGRDLSGSGWGLKFDFIIIHETGHEWFGNNITTKDIADMWVHESFTNYSEAIYLECQFGPEACNAYVQGLRKNIANDIPITGHYDVNNEGSGDMYYKGANMLHMIRQLIGNDEKFRAILRGLNKTFYHQTVTGKQVEDYISTESGIDCSKIFEQYLRTTKIPKLELKSELRKKKISISYRWTDCVPGFNMKTRIQTAPGVWTWISPTENWQTVKSGINVKQLEITNCKDPNFYIR